MSGEAQRVPIGEFISKDRIADTPFAPISLETLVIGTVLLQPELFVTVSHLQPEDFFLKRHKYLWRFIRFLAQQEAQISPKVVQSLYNQNVKGDQLTDDGLRELLRQADEAGYQQAALFVKDAANRRHLARLMDEALDQMEKGEIAERVLAHLGQEGLKLSQVDDGDSLIDFKTRALKNLGGGRRISTGLSPLDEFLGGGIPKGGMTILGARPSMGKTAFARGVVRHLVEQGGKVYWASYDQAPDQILLLEASRVLGVPYDTLQRYVGEDPALMEELDEALKAVVSKWEGRVFLDDKPTHVENLVYRIRRRHMRQRLDLVVVDYLQFIPGSHPRITDIERVSLASRTLKAFALEHDVAVLALSQLSREVERRPDKIPQNSDLRDSGQVEQDADLILLLHRPAYYKPEEEPSRVLVFVSKNKMGPTGVVEAYWDPYMVEFRPYGPYEEGV